MMIKKQLTSFTYLNITQFLGALNDNIYKLLIAFFLIDRLGADQSNIIFSTTGAVFVLPFLLFSSNAGTLADRFSKRNIIVLSKLLELAVMSVGLLAFAFGSITVSYITLFLMATQSAIFGPSKYGIIPEIVKSDKISSANGLMTSFTFLAIIIGTFLASFISDITNRNFILSALVCTAVSLAGVITSFGIEYTPPSGSVKRFNVLFLSQIFKNLKVAYLVPSLLPAMFGSAFFLFIGAYVQFNIIPFGIESLSLTPEQGGYLFLITAVGIGTGAVIAGKISGSSVELGLVPACAYGMTITLFLLDYYSNSLGPILPLILLTGLLGGMYQIPLDSYVQVASPNEYRGQIVGTTNFLSFLGVLVASGLIYVQKDVFGLAADQGFTLMGFICLAVAIYYTFQFYDYAARFGGMLLSKIHYSTTYEGTEHIPEGPALYLCKEAEWKDTLLILGAQRRRVRFLIQEEIPHKGIMKKIYQALRVAFIPKIENYGNPEIVDLIAKSLRQGVSVVIFTPDENFDQEVGKIVQVQELTQVLRKNNAPIVPLEIRKTAKTKGWLQSFQVPAHVSVQSPIYLNTP